MHGSSLSGKRGNGNRFLPSFDSFRFFLLASSHRDRYLEEGDMPLPPPFCSSFRRSERLYGLEEGLKIKIVVHNFAKSG
jgi:hypothetical protein